MCGIGAILDPAGTASPDAAERMVEALRHRGPDGDALRRIGPLALAHTRLAIIDVAGGDQPLDSEDGQVTAIVNGEIYNQRQLRERLEERGHRFATHSDSEVVVHSYEEYGLDCVRHLSGIFAFALWDERRRRLVAARDAFGVKPLYWWTDGRRVALASEIGALLAAGLVEARVDRVALDHYLACRFVPAPRTLFDGIRKLPAASTLVVEENGAPRIEGWREAPGSTFEGAADDELAGQLAERFTDAVERQMMSDVPYGAFLSGGVDSAAVVAAMAARSDQAPTTFTIGFPGHGDELDERGPAAESARLIGTDHHSTTTTRDGLPRRAAAQRAPARGALRDPERAGADAAVAVRVEPSEGRARRPGRRRAARGLRAPPGRRRARPAAARAGGRRRARRGDRPRAAAGRPRPPHRPRARWPRRRGASPAPRRDHGRACPRRPARHPSPRQRGDGRAPRAGPAASWPTSRAAGCSSRRSTSTPTCSCRTGS